MKLRKFTGITLIVIMACISFLYSFAVAGEPRRPSINKMFSSQKEARIQALKSLKTAEVLDNLKSSDFMINKDFSYKAIYNAFSDRRAEAISHAMDNLKSTSRQVVNGRRIPHGREFLTAKRILEVFPDEAVPSMRELYHRSDAITRGNILSASGGIAGGPAVKEMLVKALDDKSAAEEETPEMLGEPLRVCDIAYNELVLRYHVRGVLRTICTAHTIKIRDYHINKLKGLL